MGTTTGAALRGGGHGSGACRRLAAAVVIAITVGAAGGAAAATPWPAEAWQDATVLTELDSDFRNNLSGAHWNPETRTLWVCLNGPGRFWALVEDGAGGFVVAEQDGVRAEFSPGGDLEGITQVDPLEPVVYLMNEAGDLIRAYDVSRHGAPQLVAEWDVTAHVPTADWAGAEGITFVPDAWLDTNGFVDAAGRPYTSRNGMGGLMFVAHQNGGLVYAFDLDPAGGAYDLVAVFETSRQEASGLEFDRASGTLYIWHNAGANYLELSDLTSTATTGSRRRLTTVAEYVGPRTGNLEGIAVTPAGDPASSGPGAGWAFVVDDDNQDGAALLWFHAFRPVRPGHDRFATDAGVPLAVAAPGVRANDLSPSARVVLLAEPAHGRLTAPDGVTPIAPGAAFDGGFVYTPNDGFAGTDVFTYKADDGDPESAEASVLVDVAAPDPPAPDPPAPDPPGVDPPAAPTSGTVDVRVASSDDDAEEAEDGSLGTTSTDIELVEESTRQVVGIRFAGVEVPAGAAVTRAWIQFTVDEPDGGAASLEIAAEAAADAAPFAGAAGEISARRRTQARVAWQPAPWPTVGARTLDQRTPDLTDVVQEIVDGSGWAAGGAIVVIVTGSGRRVAESFDGDADHAPQLHVEFDPPPAGGGATGPPWSRLLAAAAAPASSSRDDAVEGPDGRMRVFGDDVALASPAKDRLAGLRFPAVDVPAGATVTRAWIQLTSHHADVRPTTLVLRGEATADARRFGRADGDLSARARTRAAVRWTPPAWGAAGESGAAQRSPDLRAIVQEIVDGKGWRRGNAMAFVVTGGGGRHATAWDADPTRAARLHVEYRPAAAAPPPSLFERLFFRLR